MPCVVARDVARVRADKEAVRVCRVPLHAFNVVRHGPLARGFPVAGRRPHVQDSRSAVERTCEEHGGVGGVPLEALHLVLMVRESVQALLVRHVPDLHRLVRGRRSHDVALLVVPRQPQHRVLVTPLLQHLGRHFLLLLALGGRARIGPAVLPAQARDGSHRIDAVQVPHLDLRVHGPDGHVVARGALARCVRVRHAERERVEHEVVVHE
mmetsp:Transcript_48578/g.115635  ORF Transcript_48578/g.115635 Transcript_48578/m.115635 type:complete len:210 (-) Transcript_48578:591-1220(-)